MIKIGIIGGAGYTAGELIRILIHHKDAEIKFVHSHSNAGKRISDVHRDLIGDTDLYFEDSFNLNDIDLLFLCSAHGDSKKFLDSNLIPEKTRIIDLSQDFRDESNGFIYGLADANKDKIEDAFRVANPGCFATAIQLSLLPLAQSSLLPKKSDINITAITGSTGAGVKPQETTHFSWRDNNISVYKPFVHQHLKEIGMTLKKFQQDFSENINFIPVRGDFPRGIFAMSLLDCNLNEAEINKLYSDFYCSSPFVKLSDCAINLKQVVNTNKGVLHLDVKDGKLLVTCAIDNLLKGASGQAVENMNLMFGIDRTEGLNLKPSAF